MNPYLSWLKSNVHTVIFLVVMIAAAVAMPFVHKKMNAGVRAEMEERVQKYGEMVKLEQTTITTLDGETHKGLVNESLLRQYRRAVERSGGDAENVYHEAIQHNRKGRGVLNSVVFPSLPMHVRDTEPMVFYDQLQAAYDALLAEVGAGTPPDLEDVQEQLRRQHQQLLNSALATDATQLTGPQKEAIREQLTHARTFMYLQKANTIRFYVDREGLYVPEWTPDPPIEDLFEMQWQYWIHEDILRALAEANADAESVVDGAVKLLTEARVLAASTGQAAPAASSGGGGFGAGGFGPGGGRGRRSGDAGGGAAPAGPQGTPVNPRIEAPLDYAVSITGRTSNSLYDVRYVDVELVVDPARVPQVLNALARRNFMTPTRVSLEPADPYEALEQGYFLCESGAVAVLRMELETIWLREWTKQFMPSIVRQNLGIAPDPETPKPDAAPSTG